MMRWKCTVAYDGTDFGGWQSQSDGNTVQDHIERRLSQLFGRAVRIHGSGRTDRGVHARGQVFHFDGDWAHGADALLRALRAGFPRTIQVFRAENVAEDFHARFSAQGKRYVYHYYEGHADPFTMRWCYSLGHRRLDVVRMNAAAQHLIGRYDFSAFSANPQDGREDQPVKDLRRLEFVRTGQRVDLITEADGYMYRMVRSIAGCMLNVGVGKLEPDEIPAIRDAPVRANIVETAPAEGLFLDEVFY